MANAGKDWLEAILLKRAYEESPIKVLDVETSDTSGVVTKGENYMSKLRRVKTKVLLGSGKVKTLSFVVKNQHDTEAMKKFSEDLGVFRREIAMYRDVLVKMEDLLEEICDSEGTFWPKCYDIRLYDRLIFEDLKDSGYEMADRKNQLGLESSLLVIRYLAKFHALSRILLDRAQVPQEPFSKSLYRTNEQMFIKLTNENVRRFVTMMETQWGDDWFVDFQLSYISSPARDLVYFLSTSVKLDIRIKNIELLLQTYCSSLKTQLQKFSYEGPIPDVNDMKESFKKRSVLPLCDAIALVPVFVGDHEDAPDLEEVASKEIKALENGEESPEVWNIFEKLRPEAEAILKYEVNKAMEYKCI